MATPGPAITESGGDVLFPPPCFGDEDIVVTVVVAVRGRSLDVEITAAPDDCGNFPTSSSLRNRDFMSSSSSQNVDCAVVEAVDSVPSARGVSGVEPRSMSVLRFVRGEE